MVYKLQIVQPAIAVTQKRSESAIQSTQHTLFRILRQPAINIFIEQHRIFCTHTLIILIGNAKAFCKLAVRNLSQAIRKYVVTSSNTYHRHTISTVYFKAACICNQVLTRFTLTFQLLIKILNSFDSLFHFVFLLIF